VLRFFTGQPQTGLLVREPLSCFDFDEAVAARVVAAAAVVVGGHEHVPAAAVVVAVVGVGAHNYCTPVLVGTAHLESTSTRLPNAVGGAATGDSRWQHPVDPPLPSQSHGPIDCFYFDSDSDFDCDCA
jgi:hypothetical protein